MNKSIPVNILQDFFVSFSLVALVTPCFIHLLEKVETAIFVHIEMFKIFLLLTRYDSSDSFTNQQLASLDNTHIDPMFRGFPGKDIRVLSPQSELATTVLR